MSTFTVDGPEIALEDICWDGTRLWVVDTTKTLRAVDPASGATVRTIELPGPGALGVAWDGSSLRVYRYRGTLLTINPSSGNVETKRRMSVKFEDGITWGEGLLWKSGNWKTGSKTRGIDPASGATQRTVSVTTSGPIAYVDGHIIGTGGSIRTIDIRTETVVTSAPIPSFVGGATWETDGLWVISTTDSALYRTPLETGTPTARIKLPTQRAQTLAHDGTDFWYVDSRSKEFVRVNNEGQTETVFTKPDMDPRGATFANGLLWLVIIDGPILALDPASGAVRRRYEKFKFKTPGPICHDGQRFWIREWNPNRVVAYRPTSDGDLQEVGAMQMSGGPEAMATDSERLWLFWEPDMVREYSI